MRTDVLQPTEAEANIGAHTHSLRIRAMWHRKSLHEVVFTPQEVALHRCSAYTAGVRPKTPDARNFLRLSEMASSS